MKRMQEKQKAIEDREQETYNIVTMGTNKEQARLSIAAHLLE
jgi:hypothetical protein